MGKDVGGWAMSREEVCRISGLQRAPSRVLWLSALVASVPFEGYIAANLLGYPLSVPLSVAVAFLGVAMLALLLDGRLTLDAMSRVGIALAAASALSGVGAVSLGILSIEYLRSLSLGLFLIGLFVMMSQGRFRSRSARPMMWWIAAIGAGISLLAIYQACANLQHGAPTLLFQLTNPLTGPQRQYAYSYVSGFLRPTAFFAEPSWLAHYLAMSGLVAGLLMTRTRYRLASTSLLVLNAMGFLVAFSLGAYIALLCAGMAALCVVRPRLWRILGTVSLVAIAMLVFLPKLSSTLVRDLGARVDLLDTSAQQFAGGAEQRVSSSTSEILRLGAALTGVDVTFSSPVTALIGCGIGSYDRVAQLSSSKTDLAFSGTGWTSVLVEQGLFGVAVYLVFFWTLLSRTLRKEHGCASGGRKEGVLRMRRFYLCAMAFLLAFSGLTGGLGFERSLRFWVFASVVVVLVRAGTDQAGRVSDTNLVTPALGRSRRRPQPGIATREA